MSCILPNNDGNDVNYHTELNKKFPSYLLVSLPVLASVIDIHNNKWNSSLMIMTPIIFQIFSHLLSLLPSLCMMLPLFFFFFSKIMIIVNVTFLVFDFLLCVCVFILNKIHIDSMICCCWAFSQTPMFIRFEDNVSLVPPWLYTKLFDCILISVMFSGVLKMKMNFSFFFLFISL